MKSKKGNKASRRGHTIEGRSKENNSSNQQQSDLFSKWEQQFGTIKDRKLIIKDDNNFNSWDTKPQNVHDDEIQENLPEVDEFDYQKYQKESVAQHKAKNGPDHSKSEFDYDWDEDESMSYLQKLTDAKTQERYENLKAKMGNNSTNKPAVTEYENQPIPQRKFKKAKKYNKGVDLEVIKENNHFKSVNPTPIDDWD